MDNDTEYDYYYYNDTDDDVYPHSLLDIPDFIPTIIVYGITFILGLAGNILIIFAIFKYKKMQTVTNILMSSLASSDLLLIIICIPVKVAKMFSYLWVVGAILCKTVHYMQNVSAICSVLTLTVISIERYYAIVHPMKAKCIYTVGQAKRIILIVWVSSFILGTPTLKVFVHMPVGLDNQYRWCLRDFTNTSIWRFHELYMLCIILVGPFLVMSVSYTLICCKLWKNMENRAVMTNEQALSRNLPAPNVQCVESFKLADNKEPESKTGRDDWSMVKQIIRMLVTVVVMFAICWTPLLVDNLLMAFEVLPFLRIGTLKYMSNAFYLMAYFNSCINPIIYGFMSKNFRDSFVVAVRGLSSDSKKTRQTSETRSISV